jgi:copper transport protein
LLAATATLSAAPPADGQRWQPVADAKGPVSLQADDLVEVLEVKPNRVGDNFLALRVFDTRRPSPGPVTTVTMTLSGPAGQAARSVATQKPDGSWVVAGHPLAAGAWRAHVVATRPGLPDATGTFRWTVPDPVGRQVTGWRARSLAPVARVGSLALLALLLVTAAVTVGVRRQRVARPPVPRRGTEEVDQQLSGTNGGR